MDIYGLKRKLIGAEEHIKNSSISDQNKKIIFDYEKQLFIKLIVPGRFNLPELAKHVLEDARSEFAAGVRNGDFVVAGENFGLGSSREHAPTIIKMAGAKAIIAKSFARIFYRNCINIGLPAITCNTNEIDDK